MIAESWTMKGLLTAVLGCVLACVAVSARGISEGGSCQLPVKQLPKFEPLLIVNTRLALPSHGGHLTVQTRDDVIIACPGKNNTLQGFRSGDIVGACQGQAALQVAGSGYGLDRLGCSKAVSGDLRVKSGKCVVKGSAMELGFSVRSAWYPMIEVCHDTRASSTFYAQHTLHGASLSSAEHRGTRPSFKEGGMYELFNTDIAYKQQSTTLASLLKSRDLAESYLNRSRLARGHLAPNADFVLDPYQDLSFFYVNAAPQWQIVNAGNWMLLENTVRKHAAKTRADIKVVTGTHGVLSLTDKDGAPKEFYLVTNGTEKRLPVPLYFWKVVYDPSTQAGIGFVSVNKFFGAERQICPDVCAKYNWRPTKGSWDDISGGHVYCCDVTALRSAISSVPRLTVKKTLTYEG